MALKIMTPWKLILTNEGPHNFQKKNCNHPKCTYCDLQPSVWCMYLTALKKII